MSQNTTENKKNLSLDDGRRVKVLSPGMMVFKRFIRNRLAIARQECANMDEFRFIVVNDEVEDAADRLRAIMLSCRCLRENLNFTLN